ncbi:hypothetical protein PoB_006196300 [Plakobranchus ocellatus]|uniref:Uncharacterized protein n=1 Tax=Plakobranchus ocellatus TaxID=259542 RepID=A0AAV4CU57_9GAST|nr:hypothetical protein PoB_006196300 [Plakobranchus ocellatus]
MVVGCLAQMLPSQPAWEEAGICLVSHQASSSARDGSSFWSGHGTVAGLKPATEETLKIFGRILLLSRVDVGGTVDSESTLRVRFAGTPL